MKETIIEKIIELNKKSLNKLGFIELSGLEDMQKYILNHATDKFLLETFEILIRYDEELKISKFLSTGKV